MFASEAGGREYTIGDVGYTFPYRLKANTFTASTITDDDSMTVSRLSCIMKDRRYNMCYSFYPEFRFMKKL
jgi:hypothetical protein